MHLESYVTSRCEGNRAMLKRHFGVASGDLVRVKQKLDLALDTQHVELLSKIDSEKATLPFAHKSCPLMKRNLIGKISRFALSKNSNKRNWQMKLMLSHALENLEQYGACLASTKFGK